MGGSGGRNRGERNWIAPSCKDASLRRVALALCGGRDFEMDSGAPTLRPTMQYRTVVILATATHQRLGAHSFPSPQLETRAIEKTDAIGL